VGLGSGLSFALDVDGAFEPGQIRLLAFVVDGGSVTEVAALDPNTVGSGSGAGDLWLALVNARPDLGAVTGRPCVGTEAFVAGCVGSTAPDAGVESDSGVIAADAGTAPPDAGMTTPPPEDEGCGCRATSPPSWALLLVVLGIVARRRR
jgi:MYXO-CTERM domain-containing protein